MFQLFCVGPSQAYATSFPSGENVGVTSDPRSDVSGTGSSGPRPACCELDQRVSPKPNPTKSTTLTRPHRIHRDLPTWNLEPPATSSSTAGTTWRRLSHQASNSGLYANTEPCRSSSR